MFDGFVNVVSPGAYAVSDGGGDVVGDEGKGLFYKDTRHLSCWILRIGGERLVSRGSLMRGSEGRFSLFLPEGGMRVERQRELGDGMRDDKCQKMVLAQVFAFDKRPQRT